MTRLLPNHHFKIQFPFLPHRLEMLNLLLSSLLQGKPLLFPRKLNRKCQSEDRWSLFPTLFLGKLYPRGLCITAQPVGPFRPRSNLVILFLASDSPCSNKVSISLRKRRKSQEHVSSGPMIRPQNL